MDKKGNVVLGLLALACAAFSLAILMFDVFYPSEKVKDLLEAGKLGGLDSLFSYNGLDYLENIKNLEKAQKIFAYLDIFIVVVAVFNFLKAIFMFFKENPKYGKVYRKVLRSTLFISLIYLAQGIHQMMDMNSSFWDSVKSFGLPKGAIEEIVGKFPFVTASFWPLVIVVGIAILGAIIKSIGKKTKSE